MSWSQTVGPHAIRCDFCSKALRECASVGKPFKGCGYCYVSPSCGRTFEEPMVADTPLAGFIFGVKV